MWEILFLKMSMTFIKVLKHLIFKKVYFPLKPTWCSCFFLFLRQTDRRYRYSKLWKKTNISNKNKNALQNKDPFSKYVWGCHLQWMQDGWINHQTYIGMPHIVREEWNGDISTYIWRYLWGRWEWTSLHIKNTEG